MSCLFERSTFKFNNNNNTTGSGIGFYGGIESFTWRYERYVSHMYMTVTKPIITWNMRSLSIASKKSKRELNCWMRLVPLSTSLMEAESAILTCDVCSLRSRL